MHKLITLSDAQYEKALEVMKSTGIESFSEFFRYLVLSYEHTHKINREADANNPKASR